MNPLQQHQLHNHHPGVHGVHYPQMEPNKTANLVGESTYYTTRAGADVPSVSSTGAHIPIVKQESYPTKPFPAPIVH